MTTRIAILDDYQNAALGAADWDSLGSDAEIEVFNDYIEGEDAVAGALQGFDVVVGMRERTPFPKSLIDRLPDLKLLITTGMQNLSFDLGAARERGVVVEVVGERELDDVGRHVGHRDGGDRRVERQRRRVRVHGE